MKKCVCKLIIAWLAGLLAVNALAQTRDISLLVGVNVPMYKGIESDAVVGMNYGQYHYNGLGFRTGIQWSPSVADVDSAFGIPVAFAYRTPSRSKEERFLSGAAGARDSMLSGAMNGDNGDITRGLVGGFLMNLFSDMEFFAGMTPGYITGHSSTPSKASYANSLSEESWTEKKNALSLSLDAGMCINYSIWRFDLKVIPVFHYNLTGNYIYHDTLTETGVGVRKTDTTPLRWFFTLSGGLSFRF